MKISLVWVAIIVGVIALQSTILTVFAYEGVRADLMLLVCGLAGLRYGKETGTMVGFVAGLIQDLLAGGFFGMNIVVNMAAGFCMGLAAKKISRQNPLIPVIAAIAIAMIGMVISMCVMSGYGFFEEVFWATATRFIPTVVFLVILAVPVFSLMSLLHGWMEKW